jgi:hypothetical protein
MLKFIWDFIVFAHELVMAFMIAYIRLILNEEKEAWLSAFLNFKSNI